MIRILLIRHAQPEGAWGVADDPGLTERGRAQAEGAAMMLARVAPLFLVSSPLRRCRETAGPTVALFGQEAVIEPRVAEVRTPTAAADRRAWLAARFADDASTLWTDLEAETRAWRDELLACVRGWRTDTAVFTHYIAINVLAGAATGREETLVCRPAHASITELALENGALRLVALGAQMPDGVARSDVR